MPNVPDRPKVSRSNNISYDEINKLSIYSISGIYYDDFLPGEVQGRQGTAVESSRPNFRDISNTDKIEVTKFYQTYLWWVHHNYI